MTAATTLAVGGEREIPAPDPIARDYILLGLRLDQHIPGLVDGYFGPADLKAQVDLGQVRAPARLAEDATVLLERLPAEVEDTQRRDWLAAQLIAVKTQAAALAGTPLPYLDHVTRCFTWTPPRRDDAIFDAAADELDRLVPGDGSLADRLVAWDAQFEIANDRLQAVVEWLVAKFRARAIDLFGAPAGEDLRVGLVTNQPWAAYNWYDGGLRSRVDINTDLPVRATDVAHLVAHEAFPGHHLEHAWKEADLVGMQGRLEASILLINAPECLISEGLADLGGTFAVPADEAVDLLVETYDRAGLAIAADPVAAREAAERSVALRPLRERLGEIRVNAALMRHEDGVSHEDVLAYLERTGRYAPAVAAKRLEFIEHPLWRTYVFVYSEGEALLRRWVEAVPPEDRPARFARLLHEQLTPAAIVAELDDAAAAGPGPNLTGFQRI